MGIKMDVPDIKHKGIAGIFLLNLIVFIIFSSMYCGKEAAVPGEKGYYTCSMHPQVIQQEPGECPICFMKLTFVPAEGQTADEHQGHQSPESRKNAETEKLVKSPVKKKGGSFSFSLAEELILNARVVTVPSKMGSFAKTKTYSGHIDYNEDPDRLVIISTKYDGWIEKLYVSKEGQKIKSGDLLMGIYSQKILASKEEYIAAYQSLKESYRSQGRDEKELMRDPTLIASRRQLVYLDVPNSQINLLENSGTADRLTYFRAPISGILIKKEVLQGSYIKPGQELFRIANLDILWIFIHIFEKDLPFIKNGQDVVIFTSAYPGQTFSGKIDLIYPFLDMRTKDIKVRIVAPNRGGVLKPGMFVNVKVESPLPGRVISIPELSIIYSGEENYVFVSLGKGSFEVRRVVVFAVSDGVAVISAGLKENELVVSNGQFLLDSEASLKEALEKGRMAGHSH